MLGHIRDYCLEMHQPAPNWPGDVARVILESITLNYARAMCTMRRLLDAQFDRATLLGGGARTPLLPGFIAAATGLPIRVGPTDASSGGTVLTQLRELARSATWRKVAR